MSSLPTPEHEQFHVEFKNHLLATTITRPSNQPNLKPTILVLHGTGGSNQSHSLYLAEHFARLGLATLRFDQVGHGHSTGHKRVASLNLKVHEALAMVPLMQTPIHIIASSMGAHTAALLIPEVKIASLTFVAPAIYSTNCHTVNFGPDFEFFIKLPGFWRNSPAWRPLHTFTGKFLLVTAGREERVNPEVAAMCWETTAHASQKFNLHFPQSDHAIQTYLSKHPQEQKKFIDALTAYIAPQNGS